MAERDIVGLQVLPNGYRLSNDDSRLERVKLSRKYAAISSDITARKLILPLAGTTELHFVVRLDDGTYISVEDEDIEVRSGGEYLSPPQGNDTGWRAHLETTDWVEVEFGLKGREDISTKVQVDILRPTAIALYPGDCYLSDNNEIVDEEGAVCQACDNSVSQLIGRCCKFHYTVAMRYSDGLWRWADDDEVRVTVSSADHLSAYMEPHGGVLQVQGGKHKGKVSLNVTSVAVPSLSCCDVCEIVDPREIYIVPMGLREDHQLGNDDSDVLKFHAYIPGHRQAVKVIARFFDGSIAEMVPEALSWYSSNADDVVIDRGVICVQSKAESGQDVSVTASFVLAPALIATWNIYIIAVQKVVILPRAVIAVEGWQSLPPSMLSEQNDSLKMDQGTERDITVLAHCSDGLWHAVSREEAISFASESSDCVKVAEGDSFALCGLKPTESPVRVTVVTHNGQSADICVTVCETKGYCILPDGYGFDELSGQIIDSAGVVVNSLQELRDGACHTLITGQRFYPTVLAWNADNKLRLASGEEVELVSSSEQKVKTHRRLVQITALEPGYDISITVKVAHSEVFPSRLRISVSG